MKNKNILYIFLCFIILSFTVAAYVYYKNQTAFKTVTLMAGTPMETTYQVIEGKTPGTTVFVIGGIHGDETSGHKAAELLKKKKRPERGTLIVLSTANVPGIRDNQRNTEEYRDLNRSFPGDRDRDLTDKLAASIYQAITDTSPDLVVDLHEAYREEGNRDFLGNSIIFTDSEGIGDLVLALIYETQTGTLCTKPFSYYGPAPTGSLNREVTEGLRIPVITIEASEEDPEEERIKNHLALVDKIFDFSTESQNPPPA